MMYLSSAILLKSTGFWVGLHSSHDKCIRLCQRQSLESWARHVIDLVGDLKTAPGLVRSFRSSGIWPLLGYLWWEVNFWCWLHVSVYTWVWCTVYWRVCALRCVLCVEECIHSGVLCVYTCMFCVVKVCRQVTCDFSDEWTWTSTDDSWT